MRARLARYASTPPDAFGRLSPARTRELNADVEFLLERELDVRIALTKALAQSFAMRGGI